MTKRTAEDALLVDSIRAATTLNLSTHAMSSKSAPRATCGAKRKRRVTDLITEVALGVKREVAASRVYRRSQLHTHPYYGQ